MIEIQLVKIGSWPVDLITPGLYIIEKSPNMNILLYLLIFENLLLHQTGKRAPSTKWFLFWCLVLMYIKRVIIQGFRSYRDQTCPEDFSPHHNIVG